jgi:hypothetical protein
MRLKEVMANMPATLTTKKEIDAYYKNAIKEITKKAKPAKPVILVIPLTQPASPAKCDILSKFTKDITETAELLRTNKELIKKQRRHLYKPPIVSKRQSFCDEIIATAYRINKRLHEIYEEYLNGV